MPNSLYAGPCASAPSWRRITAILLLPPEGGTGVPAMPSFILKPQRAARSEAREFFAEIRPFPFAGASITFVIALNFAATLGALLGQG
jgi:hypothetical protein